MVVFSAINLSVLISDTSSQTPGTGVGTDMVRTERCGFTQSSGTSQNCDAFMVFQLRGGKMEARSLATSCPLLCHFVLMMPK